ncbi:MAG: sulfotransferase [Phycisphaerae bacterium]
MGSQTDTKASAIVEDSRHREQMTKRALVQPIFLVGAERSGTTLLRLMLDHHPRIAWLQEFEYAVDFNADGGQWPKLAPYYQWLDTHRIFQDRAFTIDTSLDYPALVRSFLGQHCERSGKPILGATVHRHFDRLLHIWPDSRFIHIVRDPRDVARSNIQMGWAGNTYAGVQRWLDVETLWDRVRRGLSSGRYLEVRQEDLIGQPKRELARICEFIGVEYDPSMLDYPLDTTYAAPDPSLVGQWRQKASEHEIRLVESRVLELMSTRGYGKSGLANLKITSRLERSLLKQDLRFRRRFRIRRYGLGLVMLDLVARRLGLAGLARRTVLQINAIQRSHLK